MIVWDSREAEERNARQLLEERTQSVATARRNLRWMNIGVVVYSVLLIGDAALFAWQQTLLSSLSLAVAVVMAALWMAGRGVVVRRAELASTLWLSAQENYDRVFPNGDLR